jgi:hypothetical protein
MTRIEISGQFFTLNCSQTSILPVRTQSRKIKYVAGNLEQRFDQFAKFSRFFQMWDFWPDLENKFTVEKLDQKFL